MPANKKYLTTCPLQRALKITAAFIGGYLVTTAFHQFIMFLLGTREVYVTMKFSGYILWVVLMIVAFVSRNGWKIWGWYLLAGTLFLSPFIYSSITHT
jgi:hypothetical protein